MLPERRRLRSPGRSARRARRRAAVARSPCARRRRTTRRGVPSRHATSPRPPAKMGGTHAAVRARMCARALECARGRTCECVRVRERACARVCLCAGALVRENV
eukprot:6177667-Pleurochrysis_carterae.AAC.2